MRLISGALFLLSSFALPGAEPRWDPVERYESRQVEGWTLRVHQELFAQKQLTSDTLRLLELQPCQITGAELDRHDSEFTELLGNCGKCRRRK